MQIVRQVLEDKSNLMKKHKQEVLGRLQDTNEAIEVVAKTIKGVRERVLHEVMEDLIDSCSEEEECSTAEGGGNDCAQTLPPKAKDKEKDKRLRELVKRLTEHAPEGQENRLERLAQQLKHFTDAVQQWPEEIEAKPTRLMMASENDSILDGTAAKLTEFEDLWEACRA